MEISTTAGLEEEKRIGGRQGAASNLAPGAIRPSKSRMSRDALRLGDMAAGIFMRRRVV
ncbi:hypothetical protein [Variovorax sp. JS1663]|uniref:hypothetical protein n=1 Tax=Variovorax sp. JS1663 TaxID=1851577 RepID=UPI001302BCAA|nr:hypothetical protein [Variovorax sp. JS1663]